MGSKSRRRISQRNLKWSIPPKIMDLEQTQIFGQDLRLTDIQAQVPLIQTIKNNFKSLRIVNVIHIALHFLIKFLK